MSLYDTDCNPGDELELVAEKALDCKPSDVSLEEFISAIREAAKYQPSVLLGKRLAADFQTVIGNDCNRRAGLPTGIDSIRKLAGDA